MLIKEKLQPCMSIVIIYCPEGLMELYEFGQEGLDK